MIGRMVLIGLCLLSLTSCVWVNQGLIDYCYNSSRREFKADSRNCMVQATMDYYTACVHDPLKTFSLQTFYEECMEGKGWVK